MKSIYPKVNNRIFEIIDSLDPDPGEARPVTFWFYSDLEKKIYRLACQLQHAGYNIVTCEKVINGDFLCIAEIQMVPENDEITRLCVEMHLLADRMDVRFDGWETEMKIE